MKRRWVHQYGDGLVYEGPCLVHLVAMVPVTAADQVIIYDGRDAVSGKRCLRVVATIVLTWAIDCSEGIPFDQGIYLDATDGDVETTVCFTPLEC